MAEKLLKLSTLITDGEHGSVKDDPNGNCFLLSNKNLINGLIRIGKNDRKINEETKQKLNKRTKLGKDTILISTVGSVGKLSYIKEDNVNYAFQRSVGIIKPNKEKIDPYFLYSLLQTDEYQKGFKQMASGSVQKCLFIGGLEDLNIPSYDRNDQERIGKIFYDIDELMQKNINIIDTLSEKIRSLYTYWFVDFNFPDKDNKPYKMAGGPINKETELPDGWVKKSFTDNPVFTLVPVGIDLFEGKKLYLSTSEVEGNDYDLETDLITFKNRESRANMQPKSLSIWFARMKESVKHLCFDETGYLINDIILSTGFCGITCKEEFFEYVYSIINSDWFEKTKDVYSSGSTQEAITDLVLSYIKIIVPNEKLLLKFHELTKEDLKMIQRIRKENDSLLKYKKFLLKTLFQK